jgi:type IV fimbrial biogenesis protein FimT
MRNGDLHRSGFTLVELIIVMALLAVVAAISMPSLGRSMRERNLNDEAARFVALTEYARSEAVSQGVPMTVWIDPQTQRFGAEAATGFEGEESRAKEFVLNADVRFEVERTATRNGLTDLVEFTPDGAPDTTSIDTLRLADRFGAARTISRTSDGWSYEIVKEQK